MLVVSVVVFAFYSSNKVSAVDGYEACNPSGALWDPALVAYCIGASDGTSSAIKVYYKQTGDGDEGLIIEKKRQGDPLGFKFFDKITTKTGVKIDSDVISGQWYEYRMARPPDRDTPIDIKVGPVTGYADSTPPVITITNTPPDIQTWRDTAVTVKIDATDDKALSKIEYWWDTELHTIETATGVSWTKTIQSPLLKSSGGHTLSVIATDAAGNSSPASATPYRFNQCPVPVDINWAVNQDSIDNIFYIQEKVVSDGDGDAMTFTITDSPDHAQPGTGGLNINQFSYTPVLGYIGSDSFTFKASDAICPTDQIPAKATGTVNITVRDVNTPPTCGTKLVSTPQNTAVSIALPGADSDTPVLTWTATPDSGFYHGTLGTVTGNTVTYTPGTNDTRTVSFAYTVSDGDLSCTSSVVVSITADNPPVAIGQTINIKEDDPPKTITLQATDTDSDELTFSTIAPPARGSLSALTQNARAGTNDSATIVYTPETDYAGADITFKFKANDTNILED